MVTGEAERTGASVETFFNLEVTSHLLQYLHGRVQSALMMRGTRKKADTGVRMAIVHNGDKAESKSWVAL